MKIVSSHINPLEVTKMSCSQNDALLDAIFEQVLEGFLNYQS